MLTIRNFRTEYSISLRSKTTIAIKLMFAAAIVVTLLTTFTTPARATAALLVGQLTVSRQVPCQPGWYYYSNNSTNTPMNCYYANVTNCANAQDWGVTFGYLSPVGLVGNPLLKKANGVIVLHNGGPGTTPGNFDVADSYFKAGYVVVELAWADDWEMTYDPFPQGPTNTINSPSPIAAPPAGLGVPCVTK
jgi:hypothetical protein